MYPLRRRGTHTSEAIYHTDPYRIGGHFYRSKRGRGRIALFILDTGHVTRPDVCVPYADRHRGRLVTARAPVTEDADERHERHLTRLRLNIPGGAG